MRLLLVLLVIGCASAQPAPSPQLAPPPGVEPAPEAPPPAPAVQQSPAGIAPALPMNDPSMMAVLRVKEPLDIVHRLGLTNEFIQRLLPGFNPADLHPGTFAAFVWQQAPDKDEHAPFAILVPTAPDSAIARRLQAPPNEFPGAALGKDTLSGSDKAILAQKLKDGPALLALAHTPMRDDVALDVDVVSLLARYGTEVRAFIQGVQLQMRTQPQNAQFARQLGGFVDGLADYATITLGARLLPQDFRFSLVTREKAPPAELPAWPEPAIEAVRYLPPAVLRLQASGRLLEKSPNFAKGMLANMMPGSPSLAAAIGDNLGDQAKIAKTIRQSAFSLSLSREKFVHVLTVTETSDPKGLREAMLRGMAKQDDPQLQKELKAQHLSCSFKLGKAVRKLEGMPVDKLVVGCKTLEGINPQTAEYAAMLYPLTVEMVQAGSSIVSESNGTGEDLARIAHEVASSSPSGSALGASAALPEAAFVRSDLDIARLIKEINQVFRAGKTPLEEPAPSLPPVAAAGREERGVTEYRVQIPRLALLAISKVITQAAAERGPAKK